MLTDIRVLQLCRPLSGAVIGGRRRIGIVAMRFNCAAPFRERLFPAYAVLEHPSAALQLCRPLSGAVMLRDGQIAGAGLDGGASIVPPPFGSGYRASDSTIARYDAASIVPPPFGSGYGASKMP